MPVNNTEIIATCALGIEDLVATELQSCGAEQIKITPAAVRARGTLETAYRACLWSRVASRVLYVIARFSADSPDDLYAGLLNVVWDQHLGPDDTLAVDFSARNASITDTRFGAQKAKDAIVDWLRDHHGRRPDVDRVAPKVRINVRLDGQAATVAIDLSGSGLHRRGYRLDATIAPLRETLAAAVLLRSRWPDAVAKNASLVDPMCGSGTLIIEAALMALDSAPGLHREDYGFLSWRGHDPDLWRTLVADAHARRRPHYGGTLAGFDLSHAALQSARQNAERAGVAALVGFEAADIATIRAPDASCGHVVVNPPYGQRLGDPEEVLPLYATLGRALKTQFAGWSAHVLTNSDDLARQLGLAPKRINNLHNGALACQLYHYEIRGHGDKNDKLDGTRPALGTPSVATDPALANRLRKNLHHFGRWASREHISCYRVYDADLPEYAAAIDRYGDLVHIQEYAPPATIDATVAKARFATLLATAHEVFAVPRKKVYVKTRRRQKHREQYTKLAETGDMHEIDEGGHRFLVNLKDRLDTGIFLDARLIRGLIAKLAPGRRFLNLFAYTGTATVYAAKAGARSSVSVDLSNTYLEWARQHFRLNDVDERKHLLVKAECRAWLDDNRERYDLILLDPPTFSSSKSMPQTLDIQRDHIELLTATLATLSKSGVLLFCTNNRRFKLDRTCLPDLVIEDLTHTTIPKDFGRSPRIHHCWRISKQDNT